MKGETSFWAEIETVNSYDSRYRDSVTVDPVESKVIRQVNYAIR